MRKHLAAVMAVLISLGIGALATPAFGHGGGNPDFRSDVHGFADPQDGIELQVLGYDDRMKLVKPVTEDRRHRRIRRRAVRPHPSRRDRRDERNSPAVYLNQDRYAAGDVPERADPKAAPDWVEVDDGGVYEWHDHRMHWMSTAKPPQVSDESKETKIFDYRIPVTVDGKPDPITGTLYWVGPADTSKTPFLVAGFVIVLLGGGAVVLARRRRDGGGPTGKPAQEAW